jgi:ketosteroid isomerase-like protein
MSDAIFDELADVEDNFNRAMVSNEVARIATCMSDDWVLVTPEAGPVSRTGMLQAIEKGVLSHDSMTKDVKRVKVYGEIAVVISRGQNTGAFRGQPMAADEWITDVYRKVNGRWLCVLTHLTPVTAP